MFKVAAILTAGWLLFSFNLHQYGYLKPSALLGGPATKAGPAETYGYNARDQLSTINNPGYGYDTAGHATRLTPVVSAEARVPLSSRV